MIVYRNGILKEEKARKRKKKELLLLGGKNPYYGYIIDIKITRSSNFIRI